MKALIMRESTSVQYSNSHDGNNRTTAPKKIN